MNACGAAVAWRGVGSNAVEFVSAKTGGNWTAIDGACNARREDGWPEGERR